ncbi:unnamed protein product, partial [marine sediment metagenome]
MDNGKKVLSLHAHPDDAEFMCVGTQALLRQKGWQVHIATMASGDCGSTQYSREQVSRIREAEAAKSAGLLQGEYHCLKCNDVFILYDRVTLLKTIELLRKVRPTLVIGPSPSDYMVDHEITSRLVQTACFACGMPNIEIEGVEPFEPVPYLYYVDPLEGKDNLGTEIKPTTVVDITSVIEIKKKMLCCHESQRNWLLEHHGMDEYVLSMKSFARNRGTQVGCDYAEG